MSGRGRAPGWIRDGRRAALTATLIALAACGDDSAGGDATAAGDVEAVTPADAATSSGQGGVVANSPPPSGEAAVGGASGAGATAGAASTGGAGGAAGVSGATGEGATSTGWSECFVPSGGIDTCEAYCAEQGMHCVTTCDTGTFTSEVEAAAALTWDGPACNCNNPRCPGPDLATGYGALCGASGFATGGNAFPRTSVQCCCAPGTVTATPLVCDDLTLGMWVSEPAPDPPCGDDGNGDYEEVGFGVPPQTNVTPQATQWTCFEGQLNPRLTSGYELEADGCSGTIAGAFYFTVVGDLLSVFWGSERRDYRHAPDAPRREP